MNADKKLPWLFDFEALIQEGAFAELTYRLTVMGYWEYDHEVLEAMLAKSWPFRDKVDYVTWYENVLKWVSRKIGEEVAKERLSTWAPDVPRWGLDRKFEVAMKLDAYRTRDAVGLIIYGIDACFSEKKFQEVKDVLDKIDFDQWGPEAIIAMALQARRRPQEVDYPVWYERMRKNLVSRFGEEEVVYQLDGIEPKKG